MKFIETSWYSRFGITWLLLPLSAIFYWVAKFRFHKLRQLQSTNDQPKIIVVGNISVGGTGKTPFTLFLVDYLKTKGFKVAVISRGYGGQEQTEPLLVDNNVKAEISGDEPKLIALRTGVEVVVCPDRNKSIDWLKTYSKPDIIVADDGLQHYKMARTAEFCIVDATRLFGNKLVLPAGPLREPLSRLSDCDLTIYNGGVKRQSYTLEVDGIYRVNDNTRIEKTTSMTLVSAIGNPKRFETSVISVGVVIDDHKIFKDHHNFTPNDFIGLTGDILMTEKDAVKCHSFAKQNWYYLKVSAKPTKHLLHELERVFINKGIYK